MGILFHACFDLRQPHCFPIALWQMDGETMETVTDFIFLGSNITAGMKLKDAYSLEEKLWQI